MEAQYFFHMEHKSSFHYQHITKQSTFMLQNQLHKEHYSAYKPKQKEKNRKETTSRIHLNNLHFFWNQTNFLNHTYNIDNLRGNFSKKSF
jgi:hypothetical protein